MVEGKFLRTVLREDVYDKLTDFAKRYSTGRDNWDYGVAIQILLEHFEQHSTVAQVNGKLDFLLSSLSMDEAEQAEPDEKKETGSQMLGGERLK